MIRVPSRDTSDMRHSQSKSGVVCLRSRLAEVPLDPRDTNQLDCPHVGEGRDWSLARVGSEPSTQRSEPRRTS